MRINAPIVSERIILDTLSAPDVTDTYVSWLNDPAINRYLEVRFSSHSIESVRNTVSAFNDSPDSLLLGIFLKAPRRHIGNIKLGPIDPMHGRGDIGIVIGDKACWGKGFATDAIVALVDYAFGTLGLTKLIAGCYSNNLGSMKAFLKVGFEEEGRLKDYWSSPDGGREDEVLLGRTNPQENSPS
jgi:RimJ/RimL family protein N-acetyltransferase